MACAFSGPSGGLTQSPSAGKVQQTAASLPCCLHFSSALSQPSQELSTECARPAPCRSGAWRRAAVLQLSAA